MEAMNSLMLNTDGVQIPQLGFGVWQVPDEETEQAVRTALEAGYRHIDTAAAYGNEEGVGRAVRAAGLPREKVFITTKLWNGDHGRAEQAFDESLARLGLDYVDLFLIHWPAPRQDKYVQAWKGLEKIYRDGRARAIGVCNFTVSTLTRLMEETGITPSINQIELHPYFPQSHQREVDARLGIVTQSWSPLGRGSDLLTNPTITDIAAKHGVDAGQVVLRWHVQSGAAPIPKSATPERFTGNLAIFTFELDNDDLQRIAELDRDERIGGDPTTHEEF